MKNNAQKFFSIAALFVFFPVHAQAQEKDAASIMGKMHKAFYYAEEGLKADVSMTLVSKGGKKQTRRLSMLRVNTSGGAQKYFMYFHEPQDVRGTAFLVWKHPKKDDERWIFIPALNMTRRIAAQDSSSSFVGSDFSYEDVSGRDLQQDTYKLVKTMEDYEGKKGQKAYVVESVPASKAGYKKKISFVDADTCLPLKEEYYDTQGKMFKIFTAEEIKTVDGIATITRRTMENVKTGHKTDVRFTDVSYPENIPDDVFSEKSLKKPPAKWVK